MTFRQMGDGGFRLQLRLAALAVIAVVAAAAVWGLEAGSAEAQSGGSSLVETLSAGGDHTCVVTESGAVQCWGGDDEGQSSPPAGRFTQVSADVHHSCGVTASGAAQCWGRNDYGQSSPPAGRFTQVSAGFFHSCGVTASSAVQCWGNDKFGQSSPPAGRFTQVSAGALHTCGLTTSGAVQCWGDDWAGQSSPPAGRFTQVSAGSLHTCGLTASKEVQCWGYVNFDQWSPPTEWSPPAGRFTQVSAGGTHSCGLTASGAVQCWGDDESGQSSPPAGRFTQVSAGWGYTCGLTASGAVHCWGDDDNGQSSPPAGLRVTQGGVAACAAHDLGTLRSLGAYRSGLLSYWDDCRDPLDSEQRADLYSFKLEQSAEVTIKMSSGDFSEYVRLLDGSGREIVPGDDETGLRSQITQSLAPGDYQIVAAQTYDGLGNYELSVSLGSDGRTGTGGDCGSIELGTIDTTDVRHSLVGHGHLESGDCLSLNPSPSRRVDRYAFTVDGEREVRVDLISSELPVEFRLSRGDDYSDSGAGRFGPYGAGATFVLKPGTYYIDVTSINRLAEGKYALAIVPGDQTRAQANFLLDDHYAIAELAASIKPIEHFAEARFGGTLSEDAFLYVGPYFVEDFAQLMEQYHYEIPFDVLDLETEKKNAAGRAARSTPNSVNPLAPPQARTGHAAIRFRYDMYNEPGLEVTKRVVAHEYFHLLQLASADYEGFLHAFDAGYDKASLAPEWLYEGNARYFDRKYVDYARLQTERWSSFRVEAKKKLCRKAEKTFDCDLADVEQLEEYLENFAYDLGAIATELLVHMGGERSLLSYYRQFADHQTLVWWSWWFTEGALERQFGVDQHEMKDCLMQWAAVEYDVKKIDSNTGRCGEPTAGDDDSAMGGE